MRSLLLLSAVAASLTACRPSTDRADSEEALAEGGAPGVASSRGSGGKPVARGAENATGATLPDELATGNEAANETASDEEPVSRPSEDGEDEGLTPTIPVRLQGRWALVAADCTSTRGDAKGLMTISRDSIRFYESTGRAVEVTRSGENSFVARFAFSGEGMSWQRPITLERSGNRLTRMEPAADGQPAVNLTYSRCPA